MPGTTGHGKPSTKGATLPSSEALLVASHLAIEAHAGQLDKTGQPYFSHCQRVANAVDGVDAKVVAYLHDVLEKGPGWSAQRLLEKGFDPLIVGAVVALTKEPAEPEATFVRRAASNSLALPVKHADLFDNLNQALAAGMDTQRYLDGLHIVEAEFNYPPRCSATLDVRL
ncbi:HD domain-containing protein [Ensifer canadensis]